jgi:hypothetical protein
MPPVYSWPQPTLVVILVFRLLTRNSEMASPAAEWLPKKLSWGAIPTPRAFHLAFARGANLYVFGGTTESPGPNELFALYCLNTSASFFFVL